MVAAGAVRNLRRTSMFSTLFTRKPESTNVLLYPPGQMISKVIRPKSFEVTVTGGLWTGG